MRSACSLAFCAMFVGCVTPPDREPLPDWGDDGPPITTDTDTGTVPPELELIRFSLPIGLNYPARLRETDTLDGPCEATPNGTPEGYSEIDCTIDINELDLWSNGLDWDVAISEGACEHIAYGHYMYEAWQIGIGPTEVSFDYDPLTGIYYNEVNSLLGRPICPYDYTWQYVANEVAPNCCLGTYDLTINGIPQGEIPWGGKPATCYDGAAYLDPERADGVSGFPLEKIVYLNQAAWSKEFHFDGYSATHISNLPLANHYDPADHDGGLPAAFSGYLTASRETQSTIFPFASERPPYYKYYLDCYDHAGELLSRTTLNVREYNEEGEYEADGNPDTIGFEPVSNHPIDDLLDWGAATPDTTTFPYYVFGGYSG